MSSDFLTKVCFSEEAIKDLKAVLELAETGAGALGGHPDDYQRIERLKDYLGVLNV